MSNTIKISDVIGKNSAILHSDGLKFFEEIVARYNPQGKLEISFEGLVHCTTAFLNASIGKFLLLTPEKEIALKNLQYSHVDDAVLRSKIVQVQKLSMDEKKRLDMMNSSRRLSMHNGK